MFSHFYQTLKIIYPNIQNFINASKTLLQQTSTTNLTFGKHCFETFKKVFSLTPYSARASTVFACL